MNKIIQYRITFCINTHKLGLKIGMCRYIILVSYTGTITIISVTSYIPQDRINSILNELIELASLIKL